jgi:hypothetical protein
MPSLRESDSAIPHFHKQATAKLLLHQHGLFPEGAEHLTFLHFPPKPAKPQADGSTLALAREP